MKKFVFALLALAPLAVIAGCGGSNTASVDEGYAESAPVDPSEKGPAGAGGGDDSGSDALESPPPPVK
jgi:hypothetical protein